jgi:hypothetical protein
MTQEVIQFSGMTVNVLRLKAAGFDALLVRYCIVKV